MARTVEAWKGKTDDARAPKRVRDRLRDKHPRCYICGNAFVDGDSVAFDHVNALINGGENDENNLRPVHIKCHAAKTAEDVAEKARIAAKRQKARGIVREARPIQGPSFAKTPKALRREQRAASLSAQPPRPLYRQSTRLWPRATQGEADAE